MDVSVFSECFLFEHFFFGGGGGVDYVKNVYDCNLEILCYSKECYWKGLLYSKTFSRLSVLKYMFHVHIPRMLNKRVHVITVSFKG